MNSKSKKVVKITLMVSLIGAIVIPSVANAMRCRTCTEAECSYLADKYNGGHYRMKSDGCYYILGPDQDKQDALNEPLMSQEGSIAVKKPMSAVGRAEKTSALEAKKATKLNIAEPAQ
ncbi:hypothetical protein [Amphritea sp.]|uniref:hypothetical protein n=1 Tax=Amphritea sp. TaxID=1872502 RepID=UPI003A8EBA5D